MPASAIRHIAATLMLAGLAAGLASCRDQPEGSVRVVVIADRPAKLKDPAVEPLSAADAVLLANVAQGLVSVDAGGNIVAGLAERWNVSNDGLSYIFRLATAEWPGGGRITAHQVARILKRQFAARSKNPVKDTLGAVDDVVAMTDRVIEVRLRAPRPNLLPLLAAPEMAILRNGRGAGPFTLDEQREEDGSVRLTREIVSLGDDEVRREEEVLLGTATVADAVKAFANGKADLVVGGTFADLPVARRVRLPRNSLRFDPALGLFGLLPASAEGPFAERDVRLLLSQAVDRDALVAALNVPGLAGRATVLGPGVDAIGSPVQPPWFAIPLAERRPALLAEARRLFGAGEKPIVRVLLPEGPGADIVIGQLAADWGVLGFRVERATSGRSADFRLIDAVAPSSSAAWFLRSFRCGVVPLCDEEIDALLAAARDTPIPAQRYALLAQAAARIDDAQLFIPFTAPIRWSLVDERIRGFAGNRYARHTLTDLELTSTAGGP